ncbi:penicillin-binding transpeptidase domain-containing protein [Streptomyces sp. NPDC059578]|uniref:penicillin-binding transpeptidase domain-containing protein n=1 Tax=Streptomyces sp. NPDC059578 TaxID=3346874 RepID=UPI0036866006
MGKRRRAERPKTRPALLGGVLVVVVGGAGLGAWALSGGDGNGAAAKPKIPTGPPTAAEVSRVGDAFLAAWRGGRTAEAAALTDDVPAARAALTGFTKDAKVSAVTLTPDTPAQTPGAGTETPATGTPGTRADARFPFAVKAIVTHAGQSKPLEYASALTVVRRASDGKPLVGWKPSVVHPDLHPGDRLVTGESGTPPIKAVDRSGRELTVKDHPSLGGVLDALRERYGKKAGGKGGVELRVVRAGAKQDGAQRTDAGAERKKADRAPDKTLLTLTEGTPGTLRTTIDATVQAAAERETARRKQASVVLLKPSTGEILAVANSRPEGFNTAFQGSLAPGSTMKIVSAALLLEKDLAGMDKKHPCPKYASYGGWKFQNLEKFQIKKGTFRASFASSCNTAFITQSKKLKDDDLTRHARDVFGLGRNDWTIGVPTFDGAVPVQQDAPKAASLIGQGGVRANPLNMASVVATAKTGTFEQPYLVSPEVDDRKLASAPRKLDGDAQRQLRELLRYTATSGSAAKPMAGLGSDVGAKTGSAEVDGQKKPNGWFTAWRGDVAGAAVVQEGGRGGSSAGPLVAKLLKSAG